MSHRFTVSLHRAGMHGPDGDGRGDHLDWFFAISHDADATLVTWSTSTCGPLFGSDRAMRLSPHRGRYLDFDGEISGDRGHVQRLVTGSYDLVENDAAQFLFVVESVSVVAMSATFVVDQAALSLATRLREQLAASVGDVSRLFS